MKETEAPVVDKHGFTLKPQISDKECILICLKNAPCGVDLKQAERLIRKLG
jgi:hypothetical protein